MPHLFTRNSSNWLTDLFLHLVMEMTGFSETPNIEKSREVHSKEFTWHQADRIMATLSITMQLNNEILL